MNYQELVLSKSPSLYFSYNNGTNADLVGTYSMFQNYTAGLNPTYDHIIKKHGIRSKKIGHNGASTYDHRTYSVNSTNNSVYYLHAEAWIYMTAIPTTDNIWIWTAEVRPTSNFLYPSYLRIGTPGNVVFRTENNTGGGDHVMSGVGILSTNTWNHVAVQYERGASTATKRIYINGVLDSEVTGINNGGVGSAMSEANYSNVTCYIDELAVWAGLTTTKPANFPTLADIQQRVNFPNTKTKWWDATTSQWLTSGDEQYWDGTQWISMQDKSYKYWNGTEWITL